MDITGQMTSPLLNRSLRDVYPMEVGWTKASLSDVNVRPTACNCRDSEPIFLSPIHLRHWLSQFISGSGFLLLLEPGWWSRVKVKVIVTILQSGFLQLTEGLDRPRISELLSWSLMDVPAPLWRMYACVCIFGSRIISKCATWTPCIHLLRHTIYFVL